MKIIFSFWKGGGRLPKPWNTFLQRIYQYRPIFCSPGGTMDSHHSKKITSAGLLITLGIIFGDIGTSPSTLSRPSSTKAE